MMMNKALTVFCLTAVLLQLCSTTVLVNALEEYDGIMMNNGAEQEGDNMMGGGGEDSEGKGGEDEDGEWSWSTGGGGGDGLEDGGGGGADDGEEDIGVLAGILMAHGMDMALQCDIDVVGIASAAILGSGGGGGLDANTLLSAPDAADADTNGSWLDSIMATFTAFASLFAAPTCSSLDADLFRATLQDFESCSTFNLEKVMESMEDALVGALWQCVMAVAPTLAGGDGGFDPAAAAATAEAPFVIPDQCLESFLGKNPLGDMLRTMYLKPDQVLPCFATLSTSVPSCTLQQWPIPLMGPLLKKQTCLYGAAMPILEDFTRSDLMALNTCLPHDPSSIASLSDQACMDTLAQCRGAAQDGNSGPSSSSSMMMSMPEPLLGAPLPDTVRRVAAVDDNEGGGGLDDVPARYESFVEHCMTHVWQGWSYENHDYQQEQETGTTSVKPLDTAAVAPPPCDAAPPLLEATFQQQQAAQNKAYNDSLTSTTSAGGHFFGGGLLTGVILTGALWAFMTFRQKKKTLAGGGRNKSAYDTVEMVGGPLT
jgi:hypothetical protein